MATDDAADAPVLTTEMDGHVAWLWLDSPERRNAMGPPFFSQLQQHMERISDDPDVWCVVIAARGSAFTVGLDLKAASPGNRGADLPSEAARRSETYRHLKEWQRSFSSVADCPKPVIIATHGWCIGGGIDLMCTADIRLASADTTFSIRETRIAIVADLGTLQRLPGIIHRGHVAELAFTGRDFDAAHAESIGLVNRVYADPEALHQGARELAAEITANSPLTVRGVKQMLRILEGRTVEEALDYVAVWNSAFLGSNDLIEAMTAFRERRPPNFTGS